MALSDSELNSGTYAADSSLAAIAALNRRPYSELLRGPLSFGALMEQYGFSCSPSPTNPHPKAPYFRGGYNTQRHGNGGAPLAGLQIECNSRGVRDTPENRQKFAAALASTLETFLEANVGITLQPPTAVDATLAAPTLPCVSSNLRPPRRPGPLRRLLWRFR